MNKKLTLFLALACTLISVTSACGGHDHSHHHDGKSHAQRVRELQLSQEEVNHDHSHHDGKSHAQRMRELQEEEEEEDDDDDDDALVVTAEQIAEKARNDFNGEAFVLGTQEFVDAAAMVNEGKRCTAEDMTEEEEGAQRKLVQDFVEKKNRGGKNLRALQEEFTPVDIPVYFHVVREEGELLEAVPNDKIIDSMDVLNDAYLNTGFSFYLAGITRNDNTAWYEAEFNMAGVEMEMKTALKQGGSNVLNVYASEAGGFLGSATWPSHYALSPETMQYDGVTINDRTVPGGTMNRFNLGKTLVHEVGTLMRLLV